MQEKIKSAEAFLKSLENPEETIKIMVDRIDGQTLKLINNYSELISKVKERTNIKDKDMYSCTIIIGYLLKSHIDRYELNKRFENN